MTWHDLSNGDEVTLEVIESIIERRINSGEVKDIEGKKIYLSQIINCGQSKLIYAAKWTWLGKHTT